MRDTALAEQALRAQTTQGNHPAQPCPQVECAEEAACVPHIQQAEHGSGERQHDGGTGAMPQLSRPIGSHDAEQQGEAASSMMSSLHIHATSSSCTDDVAHAAQQAAPSSKQALDIGALASLLSCPLTKVRHSCTLQQHITTYGDCTCLTGATALYTSCVTLSMQLQLL